MILYKLSLFTKHFHRYTKYVYTAENNTRDRRGHNALELLENVACDYVLVLMAVLALKCYSFHDSNIKLSQ